MKWFLFFALSVMSVWASECTWERQGDTVVNWTSYKTAAKIGVGGTFDHVATEGKAHAKTLEALLVGTKAKVMTESVNSNHKVRDGRLVNSFFKIMAGPSIDATIESVVVKDKTSGSVEVAIMMNGETQKVPMAYTLHEGTLTAKGFIDVADFKAMKALHSINKACYAEHSGKTWQDVAISFTMHLKHHCK